ncbi:anti-sigma factor family protein [Planctomycetota bacterium]
MSICPEKYDQIVDLALGTLPPEQAQDLREHMKTCAACRQCFKELNQPLRALSQFSQAATCNLDARQARAINHVCSATDESLLRHVDTARLHRWPRLARWGVAALVLMSLGLILFYTGGSMDLATVTYARIEQAINEVPWLHIVMIGEDQGQNTVEEVWAGFETGVLVEKRVGGRIEYIDLGKEKMSHYDPSTLCITVSHLQTEEYVYSLSSPKAFLQSILESFTDEGAALSYGTGLSQDQQVRTITASYTYPHSTCTLTLYIDPQTHLLRAGRETWTKHGQTLGTTRIEVSYPQSGPTSLYDLGVPAMAVVQHTNP